MESHPSIHPVIHIETPDQVITDAAVVDQFDAIDTIFLIDHATDDGRLLEALNRAAERFPDRRFGVNFIKRPAHVALALLARTFGKDLPNSAIWADTAGIEAVRGQEYAELLTRARSDYEWDGTVFSGIAFKHQTPVERSQWPEIARQGARLLGLPTTSGAGTGQAASLERVRTFAQHLDGTPLGLASGVTAENIAQFRPYVSHVLVATGINTNGRVDPAKLAAVLDAAQA